MYIMEFRGQSAQDFFVLSCLQKKRNGTYLEIGSNDPININNTYDLETKYGWKGFMVEYDNSFLEKYRVHRPNSYWIMNDATRVDFLSEFQRVQFPTNIDYLQIDLEVTNRSTIQTLENLNAQVMDTYKFATVTFEHDIYRGNHYNTRARSREIFTSRGYVRVFSDVKNGGNSFEDWYVHPDLVDMTFIGLITTETPMDYSDIVKRIKTTQTENINYTNYINYISTISKRGDLTTFKSNPHFTWVLEHVSADYGQSYLTQLKTKTSLSQNVIHAFCSLNDGLGSPTKVNYDGLVVSPTSLRYLYHAHLILTHLKTLSLPSIDIVEVGGGYGGLCIALHFLSSIYGLTLNSYTIVDLLTVTALQSLYISSTMPTIRVQTIDAATFGSTIETKNMFLISNYCFSELAGSYQANYIRTLFPKVSHGFMAWNAIPLYNFGFSVREEEEVPKTGAHNRILYF